MPQAKGCCTALALGPLLIVLGGCSNGQHPSPPPITASQALGPAGGTVTVPDGSGVTVPAGALVTTTSIAVTSAYYGPLAPGAIPVGTAYVFEPEGTAFSELVTVTLAFDRHLIPSGKSPADILVFTAPQGSAAFVALPTTQVDATHVSAQVSHFSIFAPEVPDVDAASSLDATVEAPAGDALSESTGQASDALIGDATLSAQSDGSQGEAGDAFGEVPGDDSAQAAPDGYIDECSAPAMPQQPYACPDAGSASTQMPGGSCSGSLPIISGSGSYSFDMTGQPSNYALSCSPNYPGGREVVFELCNTDSAALTLSATSSVPGAGLTLGVDTACGGSGAACSFSGGDAGPASTVQVGPGVYYVVIEGFQDGAGTLDVTFGAPPPPPPPPPVTPFPCCSEAQQYFRAEQAAGLGPGEQGTGGTFWLSEPTLVTIAITSVWTTGTCDVSVAIFDACTNTQLLSKQRSGLSAQVLPAGIYYETDTTNGFSIYCGAGTVTFEPPPPPATNTSCADATPLTLGRTFDEAPIVAAGDRYYSIVTTSTGLTVTASITSVIGGVSFNLFSAPCGDAGAIGSTITPDFGGPASCGNTILGEPPCDTGTKSETFQGLPPGAYYLVASPGAGNSYSILAQ